MDTLRRSRSRSSEARLPRRVRVEDTDAAALRLRGADRRLADALDQLRSGVPLNWGQVEDDPEMATLARLQKAGQECRLLPLREPSPEMRESLIELLSAQLPRPVVKLRKGAPKSLAGFSESVPVLTQVEDDIELGVNWQQTILRGAAGLAVVVLAIWGLATLLQAHSVPTYAWISALQAGKPVTTAQRSLSPDDLPCKLARSERPLQPEYFVPVQLLRDAQSKVGYNIPLLPLRIGEPTTYSFQLYFVNVAPCDGAALKPSDEGAAVALQYRVLRRIPGAPVTPELTPRPTRSNIPGQSSGAQTGSAFVSMFVVNAQFSYIDVSTGSWHEVRDGALHGLYWRGGPYTDLSGSQWMGDVSVLAVEHGDTVATIVSEYSDGMTEEVLLNLGRNIAW